MRGRADCFGVIMNAGDLNNLVTIQARQAGQDAVGQPLSGWSTFARVWADVRHFNGLEMIKAGSAVSVVKASIRIRYRSDVTNGMRVLIGDTPYEVEAVIPDLAKRQFTDLVCKVVR